MDTLRRKVWKMFFWLTALKYAVFSRTEVLFITVHTVVLRHHCIFSVHFFCFWHAVFYLPYSVFTHFNSPRLFQHFIFIWQLSSISCVNNSFPTDLGSDEALFSFPQGPQGNTANTFLKPLIYFAFWAAFPHVWWSFVTLSCSLADGWIAMSPDLFSLD